MRKNPGFNSHPFTNTGVSMLINPFHTSFLLPAVSQSSSLLAFIVTTYLLNRLFTAANASIPLLTADATADPLTSIIDERVLLTPLSRSL